MPMFRGKDSCYERAGNDEPIFTVRARDPIAAKVVRLWAQLARDAGVKPAKVKEALAVALAMDKWGTAHSTKLPD